MSLPRELAAGIYWLGACQSMSYQGRILHSYNSQYLVSGENGSLLVDAGHPQDLGVLDRQIDELLSATGTSPLKYVFVTHSEPTHSSGVGRLLERFPNALACGDITDFQFVFPQYADRLMPLDPGDTLDLGNRQFRTVEAVFRDYPYSRWGYDVEQRALFAGDGFSHAHYHEADQCAKVAEEVATLDIPDMTALFAELAFIWTKFVDIEPYIARLDELLFDELNAALIGPAHGLPLTDPLATMPAIREGLRLGGKRRMSGSVMSGGRESAS